MVLEQKVLIFLYILAFGEPQRNTTHHFKVSQSTVYSIFHELLPAFIQLHRAYIRPLAQDEAFVSLEIEGGNIYLKEFNGCIRAIDGTLISAYILVINQRR